MNLLVKFICQSVIFNRRTGLPKSDYMIVLLINQNWPFNL